MDLKDNKIVTFWKKGGVVHRSEVEIDDFDEAVDCAISIDDIIQSAYDYYDYVVVVFHWRRYSDGNSAWAPVAKFGGLQYEKKND